MIGDAIGTQFKVYHTGRKTEEGVLTQFREALNAVPKALELRARMRETQLNQFEQIRIEQALRDVVQYERGLIIDAGEMIRPVRREEYGVTDLWTLFNTAQERAIQGRFLGTRVNTLTGEMRRISKAKSIKSIVADASLNKKLFDVAVQFIKH
jgi:hypothetical protein